MQVKGTLPASWELQQTADTREVLNRGDPWRKTLWLSLYENRVPKVNWNDSIFSVWNFNQSINFNTVQLCSTIQLINLHNIFFNQLVQCTISLLLSTRTQLHQQDAIVSPCGLQNHSRWIPVGDSIEIELPNLWHNEINKLQVIWVYQRNLEDWWRFFGNLSGAKRVSMIPNKLRVLFCPVGAVQA